MVETHPNILRVWLQAARPKTLWAGIAPVLMGTAMAVADGGFHALSAAVALAFAVLVQVGTNLCNDYADFRKGADTATRTGPVRVTQAGLIKPEAVLRATVLVFALAMVVSLYAVWRVGWPLVFCAAVAVLCGVLYTAGPYPLGYLGLGEPFVLLFFGPVAVAATHYVQVLPGRLAPETVVAGLAPGLLSVAILVVNNLRDVEGDAVAGKKTLAVRFGRGFARAEYLACLLGACAVPALLFLWDGRHPYSLAAVLVLPAALPTIRRVFSSTEGRVLNPALAGTAKLLLLYSVLFSAGWIW
jgi:1,4-dihydroxy-2-naphthoate octaprenyltransferase